MYQLIFGDESPDSAAPATPEKPPVGPEVLTVTELTDRIRFAIKRNIPSTIIVSGEISNLTLAGSGHIYFTLKDNQSQISCAMWRSRAMHLKFKLTDGFAVLVHGSIDVYGPRGQYQLITEKITPSGMGALELAFRQLREKLEKEGLFNPAHKKSIPTFPFTIALVTSPTGAAVRDILRTLELRWPVGRVLLYPVIVQGDQAAPQIVRALRDLNENSDHLNIDLIILGRGGGSLEDLWAFNEEIVARAIHASKLPIISGIGHEIDITIADLVADLRAATPTAAAQHATPVLREILDTLSWHYSRLHQLVRRTLTVEKNTLSSLANRPIFRHPAAVLGPFAQQLDEQQNNLNNAVNRRFKQNRALTHDAELKLNRISPNVLLTRAQLRVNQLHQQTQYTFTRFLATKKTHLDHLTANLRRHSPEQTKLKNSYTLATLETRLHNAISRLARDKTTVLDHLKTRLNTTDYRLVLKRGFSIARRTKDSKIMTSIEMADMNDQIVTELHDGKLVSVVREKHVHPEKI
ncbi:MAG: exodeoxyribonuclease VII large subunit [Phycisphaerae bacterium]|nr:exodeoxyribonuclease VII large subunit [Phycisphaerae bacterium]